MKQLLKKIWHFVCKHFLIYLNDEIFCKILLIITHLRLGFKPYYPNFKNPKTFNEHINFFKLKYKDELGTIVADKVKVREFIKNKIGEKYLIPIYGIYENAEQIDFNQLPDNGFAIKTNHGSGWNIICKNKSDFHAKISVKKLNYWLTLNVFYLNREYQYKQIKPLLIVEKLLEYDIYDYKIFCFYGEPKFIQIDINRFTNHKRLFYDINWQVLDFSINYPQAEIKIEPPALLNEMLEISKKLAVDFDFVRVDLYLHNDKLFFGELTLFPGGGFEPFLNDGQDLMVGKFFNKSSF